MKRIVIVGAPGSGKSTLALRLGGCLNVPVFERDGLGKLGSPEYRSAVTSLLKIDAWIFDGFPYYVDAEIYRAADTVIALDYPRHVVLRRVFVRSLSLVRGAAVGAHQPNSIRSWFGRDHAVRIAWTKYGDRKREIHTLSERAELIDIQIVRLASPATTESWLTDVCNEA